MRIPLSNGCYIDPCNPALSYDSPDEPQGETIVFEEITGIVID